MESHYIIINIKPSLNTSIVLNIQQQWMIQIHTKPKLTINIRSVLRFGFDERLIFFMFFTVIREKAKLNVYPIQLLVFVVRRTWIDMVNEVLFRLWWKFSFCTTKTGTKFKMRNSLWLHCIDLLYVEILLAVPWNRFRSVFFRSSCFIFVRFHLL